MSNNVTFQLEDYIVFGVVLAISASIGIYYRFTGGKQQTTKEYLLADKNMSALPVGFSLMASFMSAITLLGLSAENYIYGTQFIVINIAYIFGTFIVSYLYLPVFFQLQLTSIYEYLESRFGKVARIAASTAFVFQMVLYMSIVLYAPALAFNAVTGFSKWISILSVGLVCTFYSTMGGMKAVLWTDVFQSLLMFASVFSIIVYGSLDLGSVSSIWKIAEEGQRIEFFNFNPDPTIRHTMWTQAIGGIFTFTSVYGVNQAQVQRLLTVKDLSTSRFALYLNLPILTMLSLTTSFSGLVIYSKYHDCDPLLTGRITSSDQLLPLYVMDFLTSHPGLAGLLVSGIFSGALSTVSSAVNSLAAVSLEDFIKPCLPGKYLSDFRMAILSKFLALMFGLMCVALTYVAEKLGGVLQASFTVFGVVGGPMLGLFTLGMFIPKSNQKGAVVGFVTSLIICSWIGFGANIEKPYTPTLPQSTKGCLPEKNFSDNVDVYSMFVNESTTTTIFPNNNSNIQLPSNFRAMEKNDRILYIYRISYMWVAPIGVFAVLIVGTIISLITGGGECKNTNLLSPLIVKYSANSTHRKRKKDGNVFGIVDNDAHSDMNDCTENCDTRL